MKISPKELKENLNISIQKNLEFDNLGKLGNTKGKKILSFLDTKKHIPTVLYSKSIGTVFTTKPLSKKIGKRVKKIISSNPKFDFGLIHNYLYSQTDFYKKKISWKPEISPESTINSNNVSEDQVSIGAGSIIETGSVIYDSVKIGKNVRISPNVIIGEEGEESAMKGKQILRLVFDGGVIIGDNVKIQSNVSIKKGIFGVNTIISEGTTLGSFVNVGHDVRVGKNCSMISLKWAIVSLSISPLILRT